MVADLMPASSPCVSSRYSILKPCFSAQRVYMRSSLGFGHHAFIVLSFAEFDHADIVFKFAFDLADTAERVLQRGPLLHQLLRLLRVVPEIGVFCELVQLRQARRGCIDVKDASSAARLTA